jgi:flagellar hook protein FlgE
MRDTAFSRARAGLMTISSIMTTALSGMQTQQTRLMEAAGNIANSGPGVATETDAEISLANEMLDVMSAEAGFAANALVFETGADLWDVLMTIKRD